MGRPLVVVFLVLAGCRGERAEPPARPVEAPAPPATPFDAAPIVFDTVEPPDVLVQIPPRPDPPRPEPRPEPRRPDPAPARLPPAPPAGGPSGSCDVRASEGFCFTYTGPGWTPREAASNCDAAPGATFGPGTCPLDGRVATCAFRRPSAPDREIVYTYYAPYDLTLAEIACPGTFTRLE